MAQAKRRGSVRTILLLLVLLFVLPTPLLSCSSSEGDEPPSPEPAVESVEQGKLSLLVSADDEATADGPLSVDVTGTPDDGEKISATITVSPGEPLDLNYGPGSYTFVIAGRTVEETVYAEAESTVEFDGTHDQTVSLNVQVDDEATKALADQRAAEEAARAQAEAEAQARAQAEAEAQARAQAEAERQRAEAAAPSQTNERTVYITRTGEKYHESWCSSLRKSKIPISLSEAEAQGYEPCKNCH